MVAVFKEQEDDIVQLIYKRTYQNAYTEKIRYFLVGGTAVFRQDKYYLHGSLVKNLICQVIGDLSEVTELWKTVHTVNDSDLWFDTITRKATSSFNVIDSNTGGEEVTFKLDNNILCILEVLKNEL